ncbi:MAG: DoxX family protein [Elusimicrobiota bacterium]|jgi:uncharacterized membrane protein YphA (DoxX/SURF4 family)|nr:DoxX family protein [Elusimicrobiota bacterium]
MTDRAPALVILLQRLVFAAAFAFLAAGEALHINAFTQNAIDIGLPFARAACVSAVVLTFVCAACAALGLFFRTACFGLVLITLFSGFFFFAGNINKINLVGVLFALTILLGFLFAGAGKISLDYYIKQKKERGNKRLRFR